MTKCAFVTGGARGIGLGISHALAKEGVDLAILGTRPEEDAANTLAELRAHGGRVIYCQGSVADPVARQAALDKITAQLGPVNVLVNNAGIAPRVRADILDAGEESFEEVLRTNLQARNDVVWGV
ncbi:MAG TPA: SDR family NAD(P)-dependent oxidoreductase [Lentisphaeria bacterium]|nr:SDR family NAD(P)-dependent oxidoreductase [Lentisphaeria bacterium]